MHSKLDEIINDFADDMSSCGAGLSDCPTNAEFLAELQSFLLHLVDVTWGEANEDSSVPASEWAERIVAKAKATYA